MYLESYSGRRLSLGGSFNILEQVLNALFRQAITDPFKNLLLTNSSEASESRRLLGPIEAFERTKVWLVGHFFG